VGALKQEISIHAPERGATVDGYDWSAYTLISIHAPERGATAAMAQLAACQVISIHAPERGATGSFYLPLLRVDISIHAPERGATPTNPANANQAENFNPRSRTGSDIRGSHYRWRLGYFNPRSRTGSDMAAYPSRKIEDLFQSTLPNGERLVSVRWSFLQVDFNPRSRTGSD